MGLLTRDYLFIYFLFFFESYSLVILGGAPSLTRGRVCHEQNIAEYNDDNGDLLAQKKFPTFGYEN
jgi:hypothetical protein